MSDEQMAKLQKQVDEITAVQEREARRRKLVLNGTAIAIGLGAIAFGVYTFVKNK